MIELVQNYSRQINKGDTLHFKVSDIVEKEDGNTTIIVDHLEVREVFTAQSGGFPYIVVFKGCEKMENVITFLIDEGRKFGIFLSDKASKPFTYAVIAELATGEERVRESARKTLNKLLDREAVENAEKFLKKFL